MKKIKILVLFFSISLVCNAQKIKIYSIDVGSLGIYTNLKSSQQDKLVRDRVGIIYLGTAFNFLLNNKYETAVNYQYGEEIALEDKTDFSFHKLAILYGRTFDITKRIALKPETGIGLLIEKKQYLITNDYGLIQNSEVKNNFSYLEIPIRLKLFYKTNKKINIGLQNSFNINKSNTNFSCLFYLEYKFH
jgi:hypothetical protein